VEHAVSSLPCRREFGVVTGDGGGDDHVGAGREVVGVMAEEYGGSGPAHPLEIRGFIAVASRDLRPEPHRDQRQAAHTGSADADEVELP